MFERRVYLLGICGTFMAGLACLARELGCEVGGCDKGAWPPMSEQLAKNRIAFDTRCRADAAAGGYDRYIIGNALSRGDELVEALLDHRLPVVSGPQWLYEAVLHQRRVLCVAGTHGKTTASAMLAWILEFAGMTPGFLIGGAPVDFDTSARLGQSDLFVIEGDEYDTAFFDKRSKFVHYRPQVLVLNNLEFDHADIFDDLETIKTQFHHLLRTLPGGGLVVARAGDANLRSVLERGVWSELQTFGLQGEDADWQARASDGGGFEVYHLGEYAGVCDWSVPGEHNIANAVGAVAAAYRVGVPVAASLEALGRFHGVRRRLEVFAEAGGVTIYDDFAHHPTEIRASLGAVRARLDGGRLLAVFEPRSNTIRAGRHNDLLGASFDEADRLFFYRPPSLDWDPAAMLAQAAPHWTVHGEIGELVEAVAGEAAAGDSVVVMSNGDFGGVHGLLEERLGEGGAGADAG